MQQVNEKGKVTTRRNNNRGLGPLQKLQKKLEKWDKENPARDTTKRPY